MTPIPPDLIPVVAVSLVAALSVSNTTFAAPPLTAATSVAPPPPPPPAPPVEAPAPVAEPTSPPATDTSPPPTLAAAPVPEPVPVADAPVPEGRGKPARLYLQANLGLGYGHYWQIGGADRDAGGMPLEISTGAGFALTDRWIIGGSGAFTPFIAMSVHDHIDGSVETVPFSPAGYAAALVAYYPSGREGLLGFEATFGAGGGGKGGKWGGIGPVVTFAPLFHLWHLGASHVGLFARLSYWQLFYGDNSAVRPLVSLVLGGEWAWY